VAANQAWFEYQPGRVVQPAGPAVDRFHPPQVVDTPIQRFDEHGLGQEPNNLAAIGSLTGYRALRFGRHLELIITDQHSYRSEDPAGRSEAAPFSLSDFLGLIPEEVLEILDAGRDYDGGKPPEQIRVGALSVPNFRRDQPPQTLLGAVQKAWFLERLGSSRATWKVWGNTLGTPDWRADPQHLPAGLGTPWPGAGFASLSGGDWGSAYVERAEIFDFVRERGITGFAIVAGDRHSFWAGLAASALPPHEFHPVGVTFVTGSISAPGLVEAWEHNLRKDHPLRPLVLAEPPGAAGPAPTVNLLMHHGVRSCVEYQRSGDLEKARALSNPDLAPHLSFLDMGGHGYGVTTVSAGSLVTEFVCIPRPVERSTGADGGPLRYRVSHRARLWQRGETPRLERRIIEGDPGLSV
jgi:alkaline phosphatase D